MEMQDRPPVVAHDEKAVRNTKRERWDGEEIHCSHGLAMVSEERQPSLHVPGPERSQRNPEQLVQGSEVVARAEPAIADGEPGFQGRGPRGNGKR